MTSLPVEVHVERLLGYRVRDSEGRVVGRLEDFRVELVDGEAVITEFHIGTAAILERVMGFAVKLPMMRHLPFKLTAYRVRWQDVDLSDPSHPRVRVRRSDLPRS